jgi:hypothetical protein
LAYGHKPEGQLPSFSDPLGLLVFAALRPYGPYAHASRAACASPNQVNASPCSGPSSFEAARAQARAQARAGDAQLCISSLCFEAQVSQDGRSLYYQPWMLNALWEV